MRITMAEDDKVQKKPIKQEFGALRGKEKAKIEKELSNKQMFGALRGKEKAKIEKELSTPIPKSPPPTPPNKPLPTPPVQEQVEAQKKKEMTIKTSIEKIFDDVKKDGKKSEPRPVVGIQAKFSKIPENLKIGAKALGQEMIRKLAEKATKTGDRVVNAAHKIVDKKNKGGRGL